MSLILSIALIHILAVSSPGPDFILCLKNTLKYDRMTGIWTALGFALGVMIHVGYCLFGIAILISQSIFWFNVIKYFGAAYLIYIGIRSLSSKSESHIQLDSQKAKEIISPGSAILSGFITNLLNPKATMYFLGLFTVMIPVDASPSQLGAIVVILVSFTFLWFSFVATFMTIPAIRTKFLRVEKIMDKVFGVALIAVGVKVATAKM